MSKGYPSGYDLSMLRMYCRMVAAGTPRTIHKRQSEDVIECRSRLESAGLLRVVDGELHPTPSGERAAGISVAAES